MAGDGLVERPCRGHPNAAPSEADARSRTDKAANFWKLFSLDQDITGITGGNFSEGQAVAGTTVNSTTHSFPGADNATFIPHHSLHIYDFNASETSPSQSSACTEDFPTVVQQVASSSEDQYVFIDEEPPSPHEGDTDSDSLATSLDFSQYITFNPFFDDPITPPTVKTPEALPTRRRVPLTPTQPSESPQHRNEAPNLQREEVYFPSPGAVLFTNYTQTYGSNVHNTLEPPRLMPPNVPRLQASPPSSSFTFSMARGGGPVTYSNSRLVEDHDSFLLPASTFESTNQAAYDDSFPLPASTSESTNQATYHDFSVVPVFMPVPGGGHVEYLDSFPQPASTSTNEATRYDVEQDILPAPRPMIPYSVLNVHTIPPSSAFTFRMAPDGSFVMPNFSNSGQFPQSTWSRETRDDIEKYNLALFGQTWSPRIYCRWGGQCFEMLEHSEEAIQEHIKSQHNVNLKGNHSLLCLWDGTCKARVRGVSASEMARHIDTTDGHPMSLVASDFTGWAKRVNACTLCSKAFPRLDSLNRHLKANHGVYPEVKKPKKQTLAGKPRKTHRRTA